MIEQISIFTENRKGAAREVFSIFSKENINVLCFVNADSGEFGTMRLIVSDSDRAMEKLVENQYVCKLDSVIEVELEDVPGALENLLKKIEDMNISVDYMYVGYRRENNVPVIIIHCEYMEIVTDNLKNEGYTVY